MRNELEIRYGGIQTWVTSYDGTKIDCMLVPAVQNLNSTITDYKSCPTILLCNPNAGYYEYINYQSEWLSYINIGVNVAIWNYRGYGRSQGSPNPKKIRKDGEYVLKHFVEHFDLTNKIGVHGESLGGSVACYIARTCKVDFLFANRTFNKLVNVPLRAFGPTAKYLYQALTCFSDDVAADFLEAKCYKIVGCDPNDAIINDLCSLKIGVSQKIIEEAHKYNCKTFNFKDYFHILSKDEGENMRVTITYLLDLNNKLQVWKKNYVPEMEPQEQYSKEEDTNHDNTANISPAALHQSSRNDLERNHYKDDSLMHQVNSDFKARNANNTVVVERHNFEDPAPSRNPAAEYLETCQDLDNDEGFFKITNPGVREPGSEYSSTASGDYRKVQKFLQKQEAVYLEKSNYHSLAKVLAKIHRILEKVETVGVALTRLFHLPKRNQKFAFKMFIINLDIWGS